MMTNADKNPHNDSQQPKPNNVTPPPQPLSDLYIRFVNLLNAISIRPF